MRKTTVLVAAVAALCLMLTVAVPPESSTARPRDAAVSTADPSAAPGVPREDGSDSVSPGTVLSIIGFAAKAGKLLYDCNQQSKEGRDCFDKGPDLSAVTKEIDKLSQQIEANQRVLQQAMNVIFTEQKYAQMLDRYKRVSVELGWAQLAMLKLQEFTSCFALFADTSIAVDAPRSCQLTNINGDNPTPFTMTKPEDLYRGATGPLDDGMSSAGPVARLLFATLYQFGGKGDFQLSNLNDRATGLQGNVAGTKAMQFRDGLLESTFDWMNARLIATQGGTTGSLPTFIPGTYLVEMNNWSQYYVNGQASFFGPVIAALTLRATLLGPDDDRGKRHAEMAEVLDRLARKGTPAQPQWSLDTQLSGYSVSQPWFGINPDDPAVPAPATSFNPQRVGFVVATDGKILRVQQEYGPTWTPQEAPEEVLLMPTFGQLALIRASIDRSGVPWAALRANYPLTIPAQENAAWWAEFGSSYRLVELRVGTGGNWTHYMYSVSDQLPGSGIFGQNVTYVTYREPCRVAVRMTDQPRTVSQSYRLDETWHYSTEGSFSKQDFLVRSQQDGRKAYEVRVNGEVAYNTVVQTGAVPQFSIWDMGRGGSGTGVFLNCGGRFTRFSVPLSASWIWVKTYAPEGLFTKLSTGPVRFDSCSQLRESVWRGVGRPGARDEGRPAALATAAPTLRAHRSSARWYKVNKRLDTDGDGIACEPGQ